jgi:hypothetical protein
MKALLHALPLYADDLAIGAAILGPKRAAEWKALAPLLEGRGLPKIDDLHGGRYTPAIRQFYDKQHGLEGSRPLTPDGIEELGAWKSRRKHRA